MSNWIILNVQIVFHMIDTDMRLQPNNQDGSGSDNPNMGLDLSSDDIPPHLPPKQRELFMRIKRHQRETNIKDGNMKDDLEQGLIFWLA
jgi:hypothetical protein